MTAMIIKALGVLLLLLSALCNYWLVSSSEVHFQYQDKIAILGFELCLVILGLIFIIKSKFLSAKIGEIVMLSISLGMALVVGEIAIRFIMPQLTLSQAEEKSRSFYGPSTFLSYELKPNYNQLTYDTEYDREVPIVITP